VVLTRAVLWLALSAVYDSGLPASHIIPKEGGFADWLPDAGAWGPYPELALSSSMRFWRPETQAMLLPKAQYEPG